MRTLKKILFIFGIFSLSGCSFFRFSQIPLSEYGQSPQGFYVYDGVNNRKPSYEVLKNVDELFKEFRDCLVKADEALLDEMKQTVIIIVRHSDMYRSDLHGFQTIGSQTIFVDDPEWLKHEWLHNYFGLKWSLWANIRHADPLFWGRCIAPK